MRNSPAARFRPGLIWPVVSVLSLFAPRIATAQGRAPAPPPPRVGVGVGEMKTAEPLRVAFSPDGCARPGRSPERFLPLDLSSLLLHVLFGARFLLRQ